MCNRCSHNYIANGAIYSFGYNRYGQLGTGTTTDCIAIPVHVANLPKIKMVSCGGNFTICVDYKGSMWSFGINDEGELGLGNTITQKVPQQIKNLPPVQSISCGNCLPYINYNR